MFELSEI